MTESDAVDSAESSEVTVAHKNGATNSMSSKSSTKAAFVSSEFAGLSQRDCHGRHQDDEDEAVRINK